MEITEISIKTWSQKCCFGSRSYIMSINSLKTIYLVLYYFLNMKEKIIQICINIWSQATPLCVTQSFCKKNTRIFRKILNLYPKILVFDVIYYDLISNKKISKIWAILKITICLSLFISLSVSDFVSLWVRQFVMGRNFIDFFTGFKHLWDRRYIKRNIVNMLGKIWKNLGNL